MASMSLGTRWIGCVINPRNREILLCVVTPHSFLDLYRLDGTKIGSGQLDAPCTEPSLAEYPRSHVEVQDGFRGMGYGTSLYTGLCLMAQCARDMGGSWASACGGTGISSPSEARKKDASSWWNKALTLGLARRVTINVTNREEKSVTLKTSKDEILSKLKEQGHLNGLHKVEVGSSVFMVNITYETNPSLSFDIYKIEKALETNLIPIVVDGSMGVNVYPNGGGFTSVSKDRIVIDPVAFSSIDWSFVSDFDHRTQEKVHAWAKAVANEHGIAIDNSKMRKNPGLKAAKSWSSFRSLD